MSSSPILTVIKIIYSLFYYKPVKVNNVSDIMLLLAEVKPREHAVWDMLYLRPFGV